MSSVVDYFTSAVKDTYTDTVDYWSQDGSVSDGVDAVIWSVKNPDIVAEATSTGVEKSMNKLSKAVNQDKNKLIILVVLGAGAYYYFKKGAK